MRLGRQKTVKRRMQSLASRLGFESTNADVHITRINKIDYLLRCLYVNF